MSTAERGGHCSLGTPATPCLPSGRGRGGEAWGDGYFEGSKEVVTLVLRRIGEEADWRRGSQERLKTLTCRGLGPGAGEKAGGSRFFQGVHLRNKKGRKPGLCTVVLRHIEDEVKT